MAEQSSFFQGAQQTHIRDYAQFTRADTVTTIHNHGGTMTMCRCQEKQSIVPIKHNSREINPEDIIYRRCVSSQNLELQIKGTTSSLKAGSGMQMIKIRKEVHVADIVQFVGRSFTVYTFEPEDLEDHEALETVWKRVHDVSSAKSVWFPQRFGVGRSEMPMIIHDELANGDDFTAKHWKNPIIFNYLWYTRGTSIDALNDNNILKRLSIPLSAAWGNWTWNLGTGSWQYDLTSVTVSEAAQRDTSHSALRYRRPPLSEHTCPELESQQVISLFEKDLGGFLRSIVSWGTTQGFDDFSNFACHSLLTFGSIMDRTKPGILGYFPSTPSPEWFYESFTSDIKMSFSHSASGSWRVGLSFNGTGPWQGNLHFSLRLSEENRYRFRAAFMGQSLGFYSRCDDPLDDLLFIDEVRFSLLGTFHHNLSANSSPVNLFIRPISIGSCYGMPCVKYPLPDLPFYWSSDPQGEVPIPAENWKRYGIPELEMKTWIGSFWNLVDYRCVHDYLQMKGYDQDGRRCMQDLNYPELVLGDPHDIRSFKCEQSFPPLECPQLYTPSPPLMVRDAREEKDSVVVVRSCRRKTPKPRLPRIE